MLPHSLIYSQNPKGANMNTEKKICQNLLQNFFKKTDLKYLQCLNQTHLKMEIYLDLDGNVVPASENKAIFNFDFICYPKAKDME